MEDKEELDFTSKKFNAENALTFSDIKPPVEGHQYEHMDALRDDIHSEGLKTTKLYRDIPGVTGPCGIPIAYKKKDAQGNTLRNFTEEQGPIRKPLKVRNVLTRLENIRGPISVLSTCKEQQLRVKIYIRDNKGIRGIVTGYVVVFDKHWNVVVRDIEETFIKHIRRPKASLSDVSNYVKIGDLSIKEEDDCYVERSPLVRRQPNIPQEQEEMGQNTVFYQRMLKKLGMPKPVSNPKGPTSVDSTKPGVKEEKREEKTSEETHENVCTPEIKYKEEPEKLLDINPNPTANNFDLKKFKIPKKVSKLREPTGLYQHEDRRSQGSKFEDRYNLKSSDSFRLNLSHRASEDKFSQEKSKINTTHSESERKENIVGMGRNRKRKTIEMRHRKANQMLIRGEQIVIIAIADYKIKNEDDKN